MGGWKANLVLAAVALVIGVGMYTHWGRGKPHNVIIFVADGLRSGIVTAETAPAMAAVRAEGVDFQNSHSLYPTVTTANASAIATGHYLGDTGDFGNNLYVGPELLPVPASTVIPFLEDVEALPLVNQRYGGNYLNETSLLAAARAQGYATASIGKRGPVAIQDITQRTGAPTIVIDDSTGAKTEPGIPLAPDVRDAIKAAGLDPVTPDRGLNGSQGDYNMAGMKVANVEQQDWFTKVATDVVLPRFKKAGKPFAMVFWSRDPDGTQHNQGDSFNTLTPGINGPTTLKALLNVSNDLQRLREALKAQGLDKTTDIFVTADHGFSTSSKQSATSPAAKRSYRDVPPGFLPPGFLAIDLSQVLGLPLWTGTRLPVMLDDGFHPAKAGSLLGPNPADPVVVLAPNGGSELIYLNAKSDPKALAARIVQWLATQDYTGGIFVNDDLGAIPGTLPMSLINLKGGALMPTPSMIVGFTARPGDCPKPETCQAIVTDSDLQQGQGNHGSFSRGDTHNFMAAVGPDFKAGFVDPSPVSNADIAQTLAQIMRINLASKGQLSGRVMSEALKGGGTVPSQAKVVRSAPGPGGFTTVLDYQEAQGRRYFDAAGMPGRVFGVKP